MMKNLLRELQKEIKEEASKEDINVVKLVDLLYVYQILKSYQEDTVSDSDNDTFAQPIPKLSNLDLKIIDYIWNNGQSTLQTIFTKLMLSKSTISYRIKRLVKKEILIKIPTVEKEKPIDLTDKGKEIFLAVTKGKEKKEEKKENT